MLVGSSVLVGIAVGSTVDVLVGTAVLVGAVVLVGVLVGTIVFVGMLVGTVVLVGSAVGTVVLVGSAASVTVLVGVSFAPSVPRIIPKQAHMPKTTITPRITTFFLVIFTRFPFIIDVAAIPIEMGSGFEPLFDATNAKFRFQGGRN